MKILSERGSRNFERVKMCVLKIISMKEGERKYVWESAKGLYVNIGVKEILKVIYMWIQ